MQCKKIMTKLLLYKLLCSHFIGILLISIYQPVYGIYEFDEEPKDRISLSTIERQNDRILFHMKPDLKFAQEVISQYASQLDKKNGPSGKLVPNPNGYATNNKLLLNRRENHNHHRKNFVRHQYDAEQPDSKIRLHVGKNLTTDKQSLSYYTSLPKIEPNEVRKALRLSQRSDKFLLLFHADNSTSEPSQDDRGAVARHVISSEDFRLPGGKQRKTIIIKENNNKLKHKKSTDSSLHRRNISIGDKDIHQVKYDGDNISSTLLSKGKSNRLTDKDVKEITNSIEKIAHDIQNNDFSTNNSTAKNFTQTQDLLIKTHFSDLRTSLSKNRKLDDQEYTSKKGQSKYNYSVYYTDPKSKRDFVSDPSESLLSTQGSFFIPSDDQTSYGNDDFENNIESREGVGRHSLNTMYSKIEALDPLEKDTLKEFLHKERLVEKQYIDTDSPSVPSTATGNSVGVREGFLTKSSKSQISDVDDNDDSMSKEQLKKAIETKERELYKFIEDSTNRVESEGEDAREESARLNTLHLLEESKRKQLAMEAASKKSTTLSADNAQSKLLERRVHGMKLDEKTTNKDNSIHTKQSMFQRSTSNTKTKTFTQKEHQHFIHPDFQQSMPIHEDKDTVPHQDNRIHRGYHEPKYKESINNKVTGSRRTNELNSIPSSLSKKVDTVIPPLFESHLAPLSEPTIANSMDTTTRRPVTTVEVDGMGPPNTSNVTNSPETVSPTPLTVTTTTLSTTLQPLTLPPTTTTTSPYTSIPNPILPVANHQQHSQTNQISNETTEILQKAPENVSQVPSHSYVVNKQGDTNFSMPVLHKPQHLQGMHNLTLEQSNEILKFQPNELILVPEKVNHAGDSISTYGALNNKDDKRFDVENTGKRNLVENTKISPSTKKKIEFIYLPLPVASKRKDSFLSKLQFERKSFQEDAASEFQRKAINNKVSHQRQQTQKLQIPNISEKHKGSSNPYAEEQEVRKKPFYAPPKKTLPNNHTRLNVESPVRLKSMVSFSSNNKTTNKTNSKTGSSNPYVGYQNTEGQFDKISRFHATSAPRVEVKAPILHTPPISNQITSNTNIEKPITAKPFSLRKTPHVVDENADKRALQRFSSYTLEEMKEETTNKGNNLVKDDEHFIVPESDSNDINDDVSSRSKRPNSKVVINPTPAIYYQKHVTKPLHPESPIDIYPTPSPFISLQHNSKDTVAKTRSSNTDFSAMKNIYAQPIMVNYQSQGNFPMASVSQIPTMSASNTLTPFQSQTFDSSITPLNSIGVPHPQFDSEGVTGINTMKTNSIDESPWQQEMNMDDMYWTDSADEIEDTCKKQKGTGNVVHIMAFGDSLTRGYYNNGRNYHPYTVKLQFLLNKMDNLRCFIVENEGKDGDLAFGEMPKRMEQLLATDKKHYDWIIILGGTNDIYNKVHAGKRNAAELSQNIIGVHNIAHHHSAKSVVVTIPEVLCESNDMCQDMKQIRETVNDNLRTYALQHRDSTLLVDLALSLGRESLSHGLVAQFFEGGLHFKPRGYETMARLIFETVKKSV